MPRQISFKISLLLCFLSAFLLFLAFPPVNIEFFAWFGLVPLLFAVESRGPKQAFRLSYFTGLLFFTAIIHWLSNVSLIALMVLVLYLALYFGMFGLLVNSASKAPFSAQFLFLPSLWVSLEFLRSHLFGGFGWALLGYSQYLNAPVIQISDITGSYGVSFIIVMVSIIIYGLMKRLRVKNQAVIALICLVFVFSYGIFCLKQNIEADEINISVIQGNIPQDIRWDKDSENFIVERYERLTRIAASSNTDLVIWPETAVPDYTDQNPRLWRKVFSLAEDMKVPLLTGAPRGAGNEVFNSAILISDKGHIVSYYDKIRLVPFGEYIPGRRFFSFVRLIDQRAGGGEFTKGKRYNIFKLNKALKFAALICFEDTFPQLSRKNVLKGADFLVNITNDAWFGKTQAAYQHAQASVFRAVENRVSVVRAANTGFSCFINPKGKITSYLDDSTGETLFITGYKTSKISIPQGGLSFYSRFGDIFAFLCIALSINYLWYFRLKQF